MIKYHFFLNFLMFLFVFFCYIPLLFSNLFSNLFFAVLFLMNFYFLIIQFFGSSNHHSQLISREIAYLDSQLIDFYSIELGLSFLNLNSIYNYSYFAISFIFMYLLYSLFSFLPFNLFVINIINLLANLSIFLSKLIKIIIFYFHYLFHHLVFK